MSTLGELLREMPVDIGEHISSEGVIPSAAELRVAAAAAASPMTTVRDEQIHMLIQQLFFQPESAPVRNVGFTPAEDWPQGGRLCLEIGRVLAEESKYEVGLIDATADPTPLQEHLQVTTPTDAKVTWQVSQRLWLVPRLSWWPEAGFQPMTDQNLERLREIMTEFDFAIICCAPISWLAARVGQNCDGLVLVLTANRTRRLVAAKIKDRLDKIHVPLLGTVLADRRFPVPNGLYRSL